MKKQAIVNKKNKFKLILIEIEYAIIIDMFSLKLYVKYIEIGRLVSNASNLY